MRSRTSHSISSREVHQRSLEWLLQAKLLKDHGWLCTATVVWNIVLRAAARMTSVFAACCDLAEAPSQQAVFDALSDGLPKTLSVLEGRLNEALTGHLPRTLRHRAWEVAIDWHLVPYYGRPDKSRNELYYGKPRQGTNKFHAYASACIVQYGQRYTLALTYVRRHESTVVALRRLLTRIREIKLKIRCLLLDRAFFNVPVTEFLQAERLPFLMPVMFRGRPARKRRKSGRKRRRAGSAGLKWIRRQKAGWYRHTLQNKKRRVSVGVCVTYHTHRSKNGQRRAKKYLFATWRVSGHPTEIKQRYRLRFGIETSYRQLRQARIYTCTRCPRLRLAFIAVALILRNLWVWTHAVLLANGRGAHMKLRLELLRFRRMLDWIVQEAVAMLHDGTPPRVAWDP